MSLTYVSTMKLIAELMFRGDITGYHRHNEYKQYFDSVGSN